MNVRSPSLGSVPCRFQTTIGTKQDSHSATQQMSSSNHRVVILTASHNSHVGVMAVTVGDETSRNGGPHGPSFRDQASIAARTSAT
jgi:hypothetical protein